MDRKDSPKLGTKHDLTCITYMCFGGQRRSQENKTEITTAIFSRLASHHLSHSSGEPPGAPFPNVLRLCDLQGDRGLGTGAALSSKPTASRISLTSLPSGLLFCRATPTTWGTFWEQTREGDHWVWIPISGSQCTQPVVPSPACTLESPVELHHTPRARPHCQRFWLNWPGVGPRHGYALKSPQVILMCSQGWDPLYYIQQERPSGLHSDSSYS